MSKIWAIAWRKTYTTFTDRNLILIMIIAPLTIATIVGLAFGGSETGAAFRDIPVAIVNLDAGAEQQGQAINYGDSFVNVLIPGEGGGGDTQAAMPACPLETETTTEAESGGFPALDELVAAVELDNVEAGRAAVERGEYVALIVIPEDFSARLSPEINPFAGGAGAGQAQAEPPTLVEVYANSGQPTSASIIRSIVQSFVNQIMAGNIAIAASVETLIQTNPLAALQLNTNEEATAVFACAFSSALNTIQIDQRAVTDPNAEARPSFSLTAQILQGVGAAQAVFFALFTGQASIAAIIYERRTGTLQRLVVSPTPRWVILAGNLLGTLVMIVFQLVLLMLALILIASLLEGQLALIWGTSLLAIALVVLGLSLAVAGLGILLVGVARTPEQVNVFGPIINLLIGVAGGAFGFSPGPPVSYLSMIYWGTDAFGRLATGNVADIGLNVVILVAQGVVLFAIGLVLFNRRLDI